MIYLDHNATTPVFTDQWGNPSSSYKFGAKLKTVIEVVRAQVAELIGAQSRDVIFTSCATAYPAAATVRRRESNSAAIHAALKANLGKRQIVTSAVEHSSVLNYCMALEGNHGLHGSHGLAAKRREKHT